MTTFEAYKLYLALRLHFTSDNYDIRKTKGRIKASQKALEKNVKLQFELNKVKKKYSQDDFINYFVANFITGDKWGGIYNTQAEDVYLSWKRINESLSYQYKQDLDILAQENINSLVEDLWDCHDGHPIILKRYLGKTVTLETLVILNKLFKFIEQVDEQLIFDPIWHTVSKLISKYSPFIKIDKDRYYTMTHQVFSA
jgi:hypothetical protein